MSCLFVHPDSIITSVLTTLTLTKTIKNYQDATDVVPFKYPI